MRSSTLSRSAGACAVLVSLLAGLQGACVSRTIAAGVEADASTNQDAMLPSSQADADGAGTPSSADSDDEVANNDATTDDASPTGTDGGPANDDAPAGDTAAGADSDGAGEADSATDCSALTPTQCLLESRRGSACRMCAQSQCADPNLQCEHLAGQAAASGPAVGQSRQDLCLAALSCILSSKCYLFGAGVDACYCGSEGRWACLDGGPAPNASQRFCLSAEQNGLETTEASVAFGSLTDTSLAAGAANALQLCLEVKCAKCL